VPDAGDRSVGMQSSPWLESESHRVRIRTRVQVPVRAGGATTWNKAEMVTYSGLSDDKEHLALVFEGWTDPPLVRLHSECLTGDVFGSARCDCGPQLDEAITSFSSTGGIILYLRQEGRGIGLYNKLDAYRLQDTGLDTFAANRELSFPNDLRDYRVAAEMLRALDVTGIRLLTNNPDKVAQLRQAGIAVWEEVRTGLFVNESNQRYLKAKADSGHQFCITKEIV
jgi:GTP cyclohydrolase II